MMVTPHIHFLLGLLLVAMTRVSGQISRDVFGSYGVPERGGQQTPVFRYTLSNGQMSAQVIEYGATLTSIRVPDNTGRVEDVLLGFDDLEGFLSGTAYFGSTVGRVANRIGRGQFTLDGVTYKLFQNNGNHSLHGGLRGFDKKLWSSKVRGSHVVMWYVSPDGEEGYPGEVTVVVTYSLTPDNTLIIEYVATSSKRTPINLTNHAYFNLAGHSAGVESLYNHTVSIAADFITETGSDQIPTGKLSPVRGTPWDLKQTKNLGDAIRGTANDGFDDNFVLRKGPPRNIAATVMEPTSGRKMQVYTTQPGLQFYTSNSLNPVLGKSQVQYNRHSALCLEPQNFPDAVNHPKEFPNSIYGPQDGYHQIIKFRFPKPAAKKCEINN